MQGDRDGKKTTAPPPLGDFRGKFQQCAAHLSILTSWSNKRDSAARRVTNLEGPGGVHPGDAEW
jgi:hypothetical protein